MNIWETEDESTSAAQVSLPKPSDTPYRTPSRASRTSRRSRKSSRQLSSSPPAPSSSPPRLHSRERSQRNSKDVTNDESISILDPRRFTPTLHASLVSEILSLRRDQEEKIKFIENLESSLHASRGEQESLTGKLSSTAKETRSLKRQLALLEGGSSSALGELTRDRDEATEAATEAKKRLEAAQKKARSQEEAVDKLHELWARDKDTWEGDKRKYEHKIHVVEGRLKAVLDEVAAYQASQESVAQPDSETFDKSHQRHGSDTTSIRSTSISNSVRLSMLSGPNGYIAPKFNGVSLADELDLEDEEDSATDHDGRESALSIMHKRTVSRESAMSWTHQRNQSIQSVESLRRPSSLPRGKHSLHQMVLEKTNGGIAEADETTVRDRPQYVDTGVQYTPPPSPIIPAMVIPDNTTAEKQPKQPVAGDMESEAIEANQRRKRVHASLMVIESAQLYEPMNSASSQHPEGPLSPPRTPKSPMQAAPLPLPSVPVGTTMNSIATQTEPAQATDPIQEASDAGEAPILIPAISVHPPTSRPSSAMGSVLPQYVKDASCQVSMQVPIPSRSIAVQTDEILVDSRVKMLPKYLQPSTISSSPPSPEPEAIETEQFPPIAPPRNPRRMKSQQSLVDVPSSPPQPVAQITRDTYVKDDGPLDKEKNATKRPPRLSSLFAGFDIVSSDDAEDFADADLSDSDFRTALSAPRPKHVSSRLGKRTSTAPTSVPEDIEPSDEEPELKGKNLPDLESVPAEAVVAQRVSIMSGARLFDKPLVPAGTIKQGAMRRTTLISNGISAHQSRPRSPSLPEMTREPPFPIPARDSSRRGPFSTSAPSDGNRSPTHDADNWQHRRRGSGRAPYRVNSIRKVKSGTSLTGNGRRYRRQANRSPPPGTELLEAPDSPKLPPMPQNEITSPFRPIEYHGSKRYASHRKQPSTNTMNTSNTGTQSTNSSGQGTSVVDAIAQTMVGEWMHKYVRRRKSFGVSESTTFESDPATNGARHKRWVWLAPYERAVMWSSKQPTSGTALLGKSGRKLTIQSVLDVKDDNPAPKGAGPLFNRSILILTPARALKFTATTRERHYVWLTALSFLAHSSQAVPELISPVPPPIAPAQIHAQHGQNQILELEMAHGPARLKRSNIRDSIRVAKNKGTFLTTRSGPPSEQGGASNIRTDTFARHNQSLRGAASNAELAYTTQQPEAASPPNVPRFVDRQYPGSHGRKRSNTGSRIPPPLSFRGFPDRASSSTVSAASTGGGNYISSYGMGHARDPSTAGLSTGTNGSSDIYNPSVSANSYSQRSSSYGVSGGGPMSVSGMSSIRTSDASARPGHVVNNFFDAVGTVRMEAFISPMSTYDRFPEEETFLWHGSNAGGLRRKRSRDLNASIGRRSKDSIRPYDGRRRQSRNRESFDNRGKLTDDWYGGSRTAGEEDCGFHSSEKMDDPFRGF